MDWDHLAEEQGQKFFAAWLQLLSRKSPALPLRLAQQHRGGDIRATDASDFKTGAYNICCIVTFEDGFRVLVRFPILGRSRFRTEKSRDEISVMGFLARHTNIPLPRALGAGRWGCGPYIVMTFIEGTLLSNRIRDSSSLDSDSHTSAANIERAFRIMAQILLELSKPVFPQIGSLVEDSESGRWQVGKRPLTLNMNELVRVGNLPPGEFANRSFRTTREYFQELAAQQLLHLRFQRNDVVENELDCQKRYIARCMFKKIATQMIQPVKNSGPFHLYCDDLRPSNVLVSEIDPGFTLTGVIDWEYTYAAPIEFTHCAPWWLLFEAPEAWESDLHQFLDRYTPRLQVFLAILRHCEDEQIREGAIKESQRLSGNMAQSMENGLFWFCLAAKRSFMFDDIYWTFLDKQYFGNGSLEDRRSLLSPEELDELEELVPLKMQQAKENRLEEHLSYDEFVDN